MSQVRGRSVSPGQPRCALGCSVTPPQLPVGMIKPLFEYHNRSFLWRVSIHESISFVHSSKSPPTMKRLYLPELFRTCNIPHGPSSLPIIGSLHTTKLQQHIHPNHIPCRLSNMSNGKTKNKTKQNTAKELASEARPLPSAVDMHPASKRRPSRTYLTKHRLT
jgi:hypothetical protein